MPEKRSKRKPGKSHVRSEGRFFCPRSHQRMIVGTWCQDAQTLRELQRDIALLGAEAVSKVNWADFERSAKVLNCSVLLVEPSPPPDVAHFVGNLRRDVDPEAAAVPIVLVTRESVLESAAIPAAVPHTTIELGARRELFADAIMTEMARAALSSVRIAIRRRGMHSLLKKALLLAIQEEEAIDEVRDLAARLSCSEGTLHRYWNDDGMHAQFGVTLKVFLDCMMLLKARARKSSQLSWPDTGAEAPGGDPHLRRVARRIFGRWPGDREPALWMELVSRVRSWWETEAA